jgi:hypothetical protein
MKYFRLIIIILTIIILPYIFNSCGDTGETPTPKVTGISVSNLPTLSTAIDGYYEAWVSLTNAASDHDNSKYRTMGKFNVRADGTLIDPNGNTYSLNAARFDLSKVEDAVISVELLGDNDTILNGAKILGGAKTLENGNLVFHMSMDYPEVLGSVASNLPNAVAKYILAATSDTSQDPNRYKKGAWFTKDTLGQSQGLTLPAIPDSLDWVYQALLIDVSTDTIFTHYNMGSFSRSNQQDNFQQCQISIPNWQVPGQEWTIPGCPGGGLPPINDLTAGYYKLYITLEPRHETAGINWPFNLLLFYGRIPTSYSFGQVEQLTNTVKLPTGQITLAYATK